MKHHDLCPRKDDPTTSENCAVCIVIDKAFVDGWDKGYIAGYRNGIDDERTHNHYERSN